MKHFHNEPPQGEIVYAAALSGDTAAADALCTAFQRYALQPANSTAAGGPALVSAPGLEPDWRGAAYRAAVAQPTGCTVPRGPTTAEILFFGTHCHISLPAVNDKRCHISLLEDSGHIKGSRMDVVQTIPSCADA